MTDRTSTPPVAAPELRELEREDPFAPHDLGCRCWPHVSQSAAVEAAIQAAVEERRAALRAESVAAISAMAGEGGSLPSAAEAASTASAPAATLERMRALIGSISSEADELAALYGTLWHESRAARHAPPALDAARIEEIETEERERLIRKAGIGAISAERAFGSGDQRC